jgi:hypothetical protein
MQRIVLALVVAALAAISLATPAVADGTIRFSGLSLQTPDGQPWSTGKPVTVVVSATHTAAADLPNSGVVVVMRTDGDRTKCLEVPLKFVSANGDGAIYAGIFYPFRAAAYDGKLQLGDQTFDVRFDVNTIAASPVATTAPAAPIAPVAAQSDLPVGSVEEPDAFTLPGDLRPLVALGAVLAFLGLGVLLQRRSSPTTVVA